MNESKARIKSLYLFHMKPVIAYFISGEFDGDHVVSMEDKLKELYPDRTSQVVHVPDEETKYRILSSYNIEEVDPYVADMLWQQIEDDDCDY